MRPKILVTCPTSHIGVACLEHLATVHSREISELRAGAHCRLNAAKVLRSLPTVHSVTLDVNRLETVKAALEGVDRLLLICPPACVCPSGNFAHWAKVVLEHADLAKVKFVVLVSFLEDVDNLVRDQFDRIRSLLVNLDIPFCELRTALLYETMLDVTTNEVKEHDRVVGKSSATAQFPMVSAHDVGVAASRALLFSAQEKDAFQGKVFRLSGPELMTPEKVVSSLAKAVGRKLSYAQVSTVEETELAEGTFQQPDLMEAIEHSEESKVLPADDINLKAFGIRNPMTWASFAGTQKSRLAPVA